MARKSIRELIKEQKPESQNVTNATRDQIAKRKPIRSLTGSIFGEIREGRVRREDPLGSVDIIHGADLEEDFGKYDDYTTPEERDLFNLAEIKETAAQNQSKGEKVLHGLGRVGVKTLTEFGKGLGYIGGIIPAAVYGDIEIMTNNTFVNAFTDLEEELKEKLPVLTRREVEEGSLARQLWSPEFWATEGADGIGFLLSALIPAGIVSKLGVGTRVANSAKLAGKIDNALITGTQTFIESAAETDGVVRQLKEYWSQYRQEDGTYLTPDGQTYTQDQIDELIGSAGVETMALNSILLIGPNALMTRNIFGKGSDKRNIFDGIDTSSPEAMKEVLSKIVPWKKSFKIAAKEGVYSAASEGFQELSQFAVEDYYSKKGKALTNKRWIEGILDGYKEGLTTIEGQKAIVLGGILGLGPGAIGAYRKNKAEISQQRGLTELLANSTQEFKSKLHSIYKTNEDGTLFINPETKLPEKDPEKIKDVIDSITEDYTADKYFQVAKNNGDVGNARIALDQMVLKQAYPYLQVDGGLDIWKQHVSELSQTFETEAKDLGFKTKEDYVQHLTNIAEKSKQELDFIRDRGPAFFGIRPKELIKGKTARKAIKNEIDRFISNIEYQGVGLQLLAENYKDHIRELEQREAKFLPAEPIVERIEDLSRAELELDAFSKERRNIIRKTINQLEKNIDDLGKSYSLLFNKAEQQKAFDNRIKGLEEIEKAVEEDKVNAKELDQFTKDFYKNLESKGYNVNRTENGEVNDFGKNNITLKDDKKNIYRVEKHLNEQTNQRQFKLRNLDTNQLQDFNQETVKKLELYKPNNILSREDFQKWVKLRKVKIRNEARYNAISELINDHKRTRERFTEETKTLIQELVEYNNSLNFWKNKENEFNLADVKKEVSNLEAKIKKVDEKLNVLNRKRDNIEKSIGTLDTYKKTLEFLLEQEDNFEEFSFATELGALEKKLLDGDYELDFKELEDSLEVVNEWIEQLVDARISLQDSIDDLEQLFNEAITLNAQLDPEDTTYDKDWEFLQNAQRDLLNQVKLKKGELKTVRQQLKRLQGELKNLIDNKNLLIRYEKLNINLNTLEKRNKIKQIRAIAEETSNNQRKDYANSPKEQITDNDVRDYNAKKPTPYSTVTSVFKFDRKTRSVVTIDGLPQLNDNYQQAARWSRVLMNIDIRNLKDYKVRFVNNTQLIELGEEPPVTDEDALYAVLHRNGEPHRATDGLVYTGIAKPGTYFFGAETSININEHPFFRTIKDTNIDSKNPVLYNGKEYTSLESLRQEIIREMKEDYTQWRDDILSRANANENLYSTVEDISSGFGVRDNTKRKPTEVLNISSLRIPRTSTIRKKSNGIQDVRKGMVYAELENGQYERLLNYIISSLPEARRKKELNRIIKFIALAREIKDGNFRQEFKFKGTNISTPLVGNEAKWGIMDYFINWGRTNDNWGINVYDRQGTKRIVFTHKGVPEVIPISDLFDVDGNVRTYDDPEIKTLVDFLDTKYLNVNYKALNKEWKDGFWLPTDWKKSKGGVIEIDFTKHKNYEDFVLNNQVYTEVKEFDENSDEIPNFINQYITFNRDVTNEAAILTEPESPVNNEQVDTISTEPPTAFTDILDQARVSEPSVEPNEDFDSGVLNALAQSMEAARQTKKEKPKEKDCPTSKKPKKKGKGRRGESLDDIL